MTLQDEIELVLWRLLPLSGVDPKIVYQAASIITSLAYRKLEDGVSDVQK